MILIALAMLAGFRAAAQYKGLKTGDTLPGFLVPKILFDVRGSAHTDMFRDRLLVIDFWATNCSGCVAALPKMQALQEQFGDRVKILPVTYEDSALVARFWKENSHTKGLKLATVVQDRQFREYFPHQAIPHEVWVYKGRVVGITEAEYVDAHNIAQVLQGRVPDWPFKNDFYTFDAKSERVFRPDSAQLDTATAALEYAGISGYRERDGASAAGVFGAEGTIRDSVQRTLRTYFINQPIFTAYVANWANVVRSNTLVRPSFSMDPNQIVWEVKNPLLYMFRSPSTPDFAVPYNGDWLRKHAICFESVKADRGQSKKDIAQGVIADLDRLLGLKVRWEKRMEKVWVLSRSGPSGAKVKRMAPGDSGGASSVASLVYHLNQRPNNPYVFQEPGLGELQVDAGTASLTEIGPLRAALRPYGLDIREEQRMVDKFVFSEVQGGLVVDIDKKSN